MPMPLTLTEAAAALRDGTATSAALTEAALAAADRHDEEMGGFLSRFPGRSRAAAERADAELAAGTDRGPLHGIPFVVKDIIAAAEGPTTAQSLILDSAWGEAVGDAVVVRRLREAGAVIVGKTSTMEFAIGLPDAAKPFPVPRNPWDLARWPGGSSSGTASTVSTGMAFAGLGTDTAGSIRIPAAFCGVTGLKPTFGRVPKSGCVPFGYTLDHIGPMARSAVDCAAVLEVVAGHHPSDPYSADVPAEPWSQALTGDLSGVRIGVDALGFDDEAFPAAVEVLREAGAAVAPVQVPMYAEMSAVNVVVMLSEALAYHLGDLRTRWSDYGRSTRMLLGGGLAFTGADYVQAQRVRRVGRRALAELFQTVDAVVTPTVAGEAPLLDGADDPMELFKDVHTGYWNPAGNPVIAAPIGFGPNGLPLSMQIATRPFDETLALRAADAFQRRTAHHLRLPALIA